MALMITRAAISEHPTPRGRCVTWQSKDTRLRYLCDFVIEQVIKNATAHARGVYHV